MSAQGYDFANILFAGPCNLRCPYCIGRQVDPALNRDNLGEFPLRNLDAFAGLLRQHRVRQIVLTGTTTDPQLYRHEARLIAWLREQLPQAQLSLHTNGQLALAKMDVLNLYDRVAISLPSFDADTYEKMTGSPRVPDLASILQAARIPVKISCVINEHNAGQMDAFLARCHKLGIRRVVLRQLYGDPRRWDILPDHTPVRTYRNNPVYDYRGMEVTTWRFDATTSTSLNLFSDGTISDKYLLTKAQPKQYRMASCSPPSLCYNTPRRKDSIGRWIRMSHTEHKRWLRVLTWITVGLAAVALVSSALAGCVTGTSSATPTPTRTPPPPATPIPTAPPQPPTPIPTPTFTPTPTPWPDNVNPLTGEVVDDASLLDRVPVAIKIDNYPPHEVWPQTGINSADLIFEHYNEGWFSTRWTAIYLGQDPERVGSVRSGRIIDLELPAMYKAVFACSGFSNGVLALFRDSDLYPDRVVSESLPQTLSLSPFYRDNARVAPFNMYTSPALVRAWAEAHGVSGRQEIQGMVFSEESPAGGTPATYVQIPWHLLNAEWRYDEASGRYLRWSDGIPHTDALTGGQLNVANVVVLYVAQWDTDIVEDANWGTFSIRWALWDVDNPYRPAILFRDGLRFDGTWHRPAREDLLTLTNANGDPIPFKVGNTLFEVVPAGEERGISIVVQ